ncbi:Pentatricopeptide repeat-containing protein [Apostasia shenzhenica]|uniref:Pentatricopeptide repeat-containing protein n=1 Tax=Apostasia shenzhenica TaxID=1088818 RepID=A0A2I0AGQ3_9ASPA|nr:Pentatricopeptide repeat-containing protein [Apostasia shenzhenica]
MLFSHVASRTRLSSRFPVYSSSYRLSAAGSLHFQEEGSQSESDTQIHSSCAHQAYPFRRTGGSPLRMMQECAKMGNLGEALHYLGLLKPTVLDYNALLHCYLRSGRVSVEQLLQVFVGMKRFGPIPNVWTFIILSDGLCRLGFLQDSLFVMEEMCCNHYVPSFELLQKLIKKSLKIGMFEFSYMVLDMMLRYGYRPTAPVLNSLISGFSRVGKIHKAYSIFWVLLEKSFLPEVYSYNPILFGLCKSGRIHTALSFFCFLRKRGFAHNVYTYTSLILGFSREGLWDEAYWVLDQMKHESCMPTVVTYTLLIKYLCEYDKVEDALKIFKMMVVTGCNADQIAYNSLLHGLCRHRRIMDAHKLVEDMVEKGCHPDSFSYCTLAAGMLKAGQVRKSQELLIKVLPGNDPQDVAPWNVYFHSLCVEKHVMDSVSLLRSKIEEGFIPSNATYNTILKGFCLEKKLKDALCFLDQCDWGRSGPDMISFNTILSAACKQGNSSLIRIVLCRMELEGIEANIISMTCLMEFLGKTGKLRECLRFFGHLLKNGYNPTTVTYNVLLNILCKVQLHKVAHRVFNEFKGCCTFPDIISHNILINVSVREGDYLSMWCLLAHMYRWGLLPDSITYGLLSYGLCRVRSISDALHLERAMIQQEVRPSIFFYNAILDTMFRTDKLGDIFCLLRKMEIEGVELNDISYKILDRTLSKVGRVIERLMGRHKNELVGAELKYLTFIHR